MQDPKDRHSISYSIAYVRVCEWARGEEQARRPKPEILDKALAHAKRLGDDYIIEKIQEAYDAWRTLDETPTPRDCLPPPSAIAFEEDDRLTQKFRIFRRPEWFVSEMAPSPEKLDLELDQFLSDISIWE